MNALILLLLAGLTHATRSFSADGEPGSSGTSLALGYLLISGYFAGRVVDRLGMPKLTGYLLIGILTGPAGLGLVTQAMIERLSLVNGMAVAMIALTAGTELELSRIRPLARTVLGVTVLGVLATIAWLALTLWWARPLLPFLSDIASGPAASITLVLAIVMVAQSPAIVVALHDELRADGPVARTVLAVVVLADLIVILLFALAGAFARTTFGEKAGMLHTLASLGWEIGGSFAVGAVVAGLLALYLRKVKVDAALMLLVLTFIIAEVGSWLGLDPLLVALTAGALLRNASPLADDLHQPLEVSALPVYVLFFCLAGAAFRADALAAVWLPALLMVLVRGIGLYAGSRVGARLAGAPLTVQRFAGIGLWPQAGLAQALALLFSRTFPEFSEQAGALVLSVVAINVLISPIAYRFALIRSNEAGRDALSASSWSEPPDPVRS